MEVDMQDPEFIVAEASTTWIDNNPSGQTTAKKFEFIINTNRARKYQLESWKFSSTFIYDPSNRSRIIVETVIAVFKKVF